MKIFDISLRAFGIYAACLLVFTTLALCGYYLPDNSHIKRTGGKAQKTFASDMTYYDLPRMTLAVGSGTEQTHVRLDISLEVAKKDLPILQGYQPKITDKLNVFIVNLHPDQVAEAGALAWLKSAMLEQVNEAGAPIPVHDILLRQMIVM